MHDVFKMVKEIVDSAINKVAKTILRSNNSFFKFPIPINKKPNILWISRSIFLIAFDFIKRRSISSTLNSKVSIF